MQRTREPGAGYPRRDGVGGWAAQASCRRPGAPEMHPTDPDGVIVALRCCARCPVREACLEHALENNERNGVWGGTSERERVRLIRERRLADAVEQEWEAVG